MQYLLQFAPKIRVFKERNDPFTELTDEEFRKRFRLSKAAVSTVLKQVFHNSKTPLRWTDVYLFCLHVLCTIVYELSLSMFCLCVVTTDIQDKYSVFTREAFVQVDDKASAGMVMLYIKQVLECAWTSVDMLYCMPGSALRLSCSLCRLTVQPL